MRPGRPPKQRVRVGAGQYRDGCRNAATNAAATNAYAYSDGDAMRAWNTNAYASTGDADANTNGDSSSITYTDTDAFSYTYCNNTTIPDAYTHSYPQGNTKASAHSASSADSVISPDSPVRGDW